MAISTESIKMKLITVIGHLVSDEKEAARKLLMVTLREVAFRTIIDVDEKQCMEIIDIIGEALMCTVSGKKQDAKKEIRKAGDEIFMKSIFTRHMILRESDGDLSMLPYDVREKIASFI